MSDHETNALLQHLCGLLESKQNDNAAHFQEEWRSQFAVRSQYIQETASPNWLRDYSETSMTQISLRDVRHGLRDRPCAIWWTVEAYGRDLARVIPPGATGVGWGDAFGAGYLSSSAVLKISQNGDKPIFVDVGTGVRFSLLTDQINVSLLVPSQRAQFAIQTEPPPVQGVEEETVIDSSTSVIITCSEYGGPIGNRISTLTRSYLQTDTDVPGPFANTLGATLRGANDGVLAGDFVVPPRARTVQFSTSEPPTATNPIFFLDNPVSRNVVANYEWDGVTAISPRIEIPRNASIINVALVSAPSPVTAFYELEL